MVILFLLRALTQDGHFLIECVHNCGHALPPFPPNPTGQSVFQPLWDFGFHHPFWLAPSLRKRSAERARCYAGRVIEFRHEIVASDADIDELGHVSNVAYVRWIQEVARAHSNAAGWDFAAYQRLGAVWVVKRHDVEYLRPAFASDRIVLFTWVARWQGASAERVTRIARAGEVELARGVTLWALVATDTGRPRRIPPQMKQAFEATRHP